MSLNLIENEVLDFLKENRIVPTNWDGTDEVRAAVLDALDEVCLYGNFFEDSVEVPLKADVHVYKMSFDRVIVGVRHCRIVDLSRTLEHVSIGRLAKDDPNWLLTRGSPWRYSVLDFTKVLFYPCPSSDDLVAQLEVVSVPLSYAAPLVEPEMVREFFEVVLQGALANIYLTIPGGEEKATLYYQMFLGGASASSDYQRKWNTLIYRMMRGANE